MAEFLSALWDVLGAMGLVMLVRVCWEVGALVAQAATAKFWPRPRPCIRQGHDGYGRGFEYFLDDWGRVIWIARKPEIDQGEAV